MKIEVKNMIVKISPYKLFLLEEILNGVIKDYPYDLLSRFGELGKEQVVEIRNELFGQKS